MGKKPNNKSGKIDTKAANPRKNNLWLILGGATLMVCMVWVTLRVTQSHSTESSSEPALALIATLSPEMYTGKARAAYQAAKEIPEILVQLPCFCGCIDSLGHRNNLYCFADTHGSICDLCQDIALSAQEMHRKGMPVNQIRDNIVKTYGSAHS